ncbi:unnamed protein product [Lactuca virosa]|uniref:Cyanobacterial aminoacyl-tRNA synthetase CAAD domain-containing protein n=1 Tax=Lactuca virosa TaxID=75947 RepID=A0AAU9L958_9ASTR|nr:unnamed protein product [Lactuca virosa]
MATAFAATTSSPATAVGLPQLPTTLYVPCSVLPYLPTRSFSSLIKHVSELQVTGFNYECCFVYMCVLYTMKLSTFFVLPWSRRSFMFQIKASEDASFAPDANELFNDLKEKWNALENKSTVVVYGGGAVVAIWISSILVGVFNSVSLVCFLDVVCILWS